MIIQGTCLSFPVRPDARGSLASVTDAKAVVEQEIVSLIETRPGERILVQDYGIPDYAFAVKGAGAAKALGYILRQQAAKYIPGVERIEVQSIDAGEHEVMLRLLWWPRGGNTPENLVFPTRRLRADLE